MSLLFKCDAAEQWQVFGELARQLGARSSEWSRAPPSSGSGIDSAWHLWIADRGALPWKSFGALPIAPNGVSRRLVNYFRGFEELTMKSKMARNIMAYCAQTNADAFEHMPESFIVQPGASVEHPERVRFVQREHELVDAGLACKWIAKATHLAKGDAICIRDSVAAVCAYVDSFAPRTVDSSDSGNAAEASAPSPAPRVAALPPRRAAPPPSWLVQRYIERPLLIHGHKFDMRVWALLTHDYRVYVYRDGVCRLAAAPFAPDTYASDDFAFAHLTNHCIAARHADYGKIAPGNELFFDEFQAYLTETASPRSVAADLMPQIAQVVALAFRSVRELLQPPPDAPVTSFQLFGFDLMLDQDWRLQLLEVNATPACAQKLLTRIVADLIELAVAPVFAVDGGHSESDGAPTSRSWLRVDV